MESLRGYEIKGRKGLAHWSALLEEWLLATERYCRIVEGEEAPYMFNERANLSALSGAAWRAGWIALEEFQHSKTYTGKEPQYGRADLWLNTGKIEEIVEAKFQWIAMGSNKTPELVERSMNSAVTDAKASQNDSDIRATGAGFFPLYKKSTRIQDGEIDSLIDQTIDEFRGFDHHALAWCFPPEMRDFEHEITQNNLPGVILLVKNCEHCIAD